MTADDGNWRYVCLTAIYMRDCQIVDSQFVLIIIIADDIMIPQNLLRRLIMENFTNWPRAIRNDFLTVTRPIRLWREFLKNAVKWQAR